MSVGDNTIATWCGELGDLDQQIVDLQKAKRDAFQRIRDEHGKVLADAVKNALRLSRLTSEQKSQRLEIDAETDRILRIIESGLTRRAPRARENIEQFDRETGEFLEAGNPVSDSSTAARKDAPNHNAPGHGAVNAGGAGTQAPPVDTSSQEHAASSMGDNASRAPSAGTGGEQDRQLTPHGDGDIADAASGDGPCMDADIAADEAEPPQVEASSVPANPDRPRRTLAEMRGVFAGEPRKRIQLVDDEPTEGGENVDPQVLGEVETHASPAINPDCAHPDTCQFATKSYCCSQCSSARSARLQAQRKVRA